MTEKQKIAFIGPIEYSNAMRFAGFECFGVSTEDETLDLIEKLDNQGYALIFVSQDIAPTEVNIDKVVTLPGVVKKDDPEELKKEIIKAIGGEIDLSVK